MNTPATPPPEAPLPWASGGYSIKRHGVSLTNCDSEPVQTPGCIQAHGALLVLRMSDLVILQVSENARDFLGAAPDALLGKSIGDVVSADGARRLLGEWERERLPDPAIVLLDLNTPGTDGRDALRTMRQNDRLRTLPLVILSTSANPRDVEFCYAAGANAYHTKPVDYAAHLQVLCDIFDYWVHRVTLPPPPR